jgi:glycosyltransferase involved in cell wall biosynthesis
MTPANTTYSKPKVLIVEHDNIVGGGNVYVERLVDLLKSEVDFYSVVVQPDHARRMRSAGVPTKTIPFPNLPARFVIGFLLCVCMICKYKIKLVQLNGAGPASYALLFKLLGIKVIIARHVAVSYEKNVFKQKLYRFNCRCADRIVSVSQTVADEHDFVHSKKVCTILNWVDEKPQEFYAVDNDVREKMIMYTSRLDETKGLLELLQAAKQKTDWLLHIYGYGPLREAAERYCQENSVNAFFYGFKKMESSYYLGINAFVQPSHSEGFSLAACEAMSYGMPCVLSNIPAHREISDNGRCAILFRTGDPHDLGEKLECLLNDHKMQAEIGSRAYEFVRLKYSEVVARDAYTALYVNL